MIATYRCCAKINTETINYNCCQSSFKQSYLYLAHCPIWVFWSIFSEKVLCICTGCVFCWILCLVWNFEWLDLWETACFNVWAEKVPRGLVTWLPPPVQWSPNNAPGLGRNPSVTLVLGENHAAHKARKSGFLLKYRAQTTHPFHFARSQLSATLQFSSGFLLILIWISRNLGTAISLAIFQPRPKDSKSFASRTNGMQ